MVLPHLRKKSPHERVIDAENGITFALYGEAAVLEPGSDIAMSPEGEQNESDLALKALLAAVLDLKEAVSVQHESADVRRLEVLMEELKRYDSEQARTGDTGDSRHDQAHETEVCYP